MLSSSNTCEQISNLIDIYIVIVVCFLWQQLGCFYICYFEFLIVRLFGSDSLKYRYTTQKRKMYNLLFVRVFEMQTPFFVKYCVLSVCQNFAFVCCSFEFGMELFAPFCLIFRIQFVKFNLYIFLKNTYCERFSTSIRKIDRSTQTTQLTSSIARKRLEFDYKMNI